MLVAVLAAQPLRAEEPTDFVPQFLGAQYTFIDQHQDSLHSPYSGPLSIKANGDTARSHTFGAYFGASLPAHFQFYFDAEMFKGEGVSNAAGLGGLTNGDVIRSGTVNLGKRPYAARHYLRYVLPLGEETVDPEHAQDQLPGKEYARRVEAKLGKFAANDDFDKNRYADSTRTQFMNWSLWNNTAWDFAADTRGYSNGLMLAWIDRGWSLRYGVFQMPTEANGQALERSLTRTRGEQVELTVQPAPGDWALRLLAFRNIARMGNYRDALALAARSGQPPDIRADDRDGRRKYGYAANLELPLADGGETGLFARAGWNDGRTESFAFTEVDRTLSVGAQISGVHWRRADDRLAIAIAVNGLSSDHRDYLAAGGNGFLLGDGRLNYGRERILEAYYRIQLLPHLQVSPDIQLIHNPGYNRDRGPARYIGLRTHLEF
ncbi:carbohydrate porin [Dokdonella soli]|uniref:Porin n=1 Tax=Dokdonella soli TaxID=529810 RepID=A0ABP3TLZ2_9GAMM